MAFHDNCFATFHNEEELEDVNNGVHGTVNDSNLEAGQ